MSKTSKFFFTFATIILSLGIILPPQVIAETYEEVSEKQLFQTIQSIEIEEGLTIPEQTLLYGTELEGTVEIQYGQIETKVDRELVTNEGINEESAIFKEYEIDSIILKDLLIGTTLTTTDLSHPFTITVNHPVEYPVHINEEEQEFLFIGNIEYEILDPKEVEEENIFPPITEVVEEKEIVEETEEIEEEQASAEKEETPVIEDEEETPLVEEEEELAEEVKVTPSAIKAEISSNPWKGVSSDYFTVVTADNPTVYDNRTGALIKVGTLTAGKEYKRVSDYGKWHRIQFGDIYGYVRKSFTEPSSGASIKNENKRYTSTSRSFTTEESITVYDNTSGSLVPFGTIDKGVNYAITSDYGNWWRVIYSDMVGYVNKNNTKVDFNKTDSYFKVTTDNLPIFDNRTGALIQVGTLEKGKTYKRVSDYGNWHRIQFGDIYGYVFKGGTEFTFSTSLPNENKRYQNMIMNFTTLSDVTVYDNSSGSLVPIGKINKDVDYAIASDYGGWWRIIYSDTVGYVHKNNVKLNAVKIFLDAGHGGSDPGGSGFGLNEKDIVLDIALKTANFLRSNYGNVVVEMSRTTDKYLSLGERTTMANNWGADFLVSLHTNAWLGKGQGFESFIYNGTVSQETRDRQVDIHDYLVDRIPVVDRGKKRANFHMIRESTMPALLLEYMFIDNKRENDMLRSASYRTTLARITAEAIAKSFNLPLK